MRYLSKHRTRRVAQRVPLPGSTQIPNSAGGFAWAVDDWARLRRFLVLGSEGGSYYASEKNLTRKNAKAVAQCVAADGLRTVAEIVAVSTDGRAPKVQRTTTHRQNPRCADRRRSGARSAGLDCARAAAAKFRQQP